MAVLAATVGAPAAAFGSSAIVAWANASGPVAGYLVHANVDGKGFAFLGLAPNNAFVVNGQPGERWVIRVAAYDAVGTIGPWSASSSPIQFQATGSGGGSSGGGGSGPGPSGGFAGISFPPPGLAIGGDSIWKSRATGAIGFGIPSSAGFVSVSTGLDKNPVATDDFDGDGRRDLLVHDPGTGTVDIWLMNGTSIESKVRLPARRTTPWEAVAALDADGDGDADILFWNRATGATELWSMEGTTHGETLRPGRAVPAQRGSFVGAGDFDGDGFDDVAWHDDVSGDVTVWPLPGLLSVQWVLGTAPGLVPVGVSDFDGDGTSNLLWRDPATGGISAWLARDGIEATEIFPASGPEWRVIDVSDANVPGQVELLWRNDVTREIYRWQLSSVAPPNISFVATLPDENWEMITDFR